MEREKNREFDNEKRKRESRGILFPLASKATGLPVASLPVFLPIIGNKFFYR